MKTRNGFVSNSSSSSFIIIGNKLDYKIPDDKLILYEKYEVFGIVEKERYVIGDYEFGWEYETYDDFDSKLNFAYLQALQCHKDNYLDMIYNVLRKNGINNPQHNFVVGDYHCKTLNDSYAYIDHQSLIDEDSEIEKMFESEETLEKFLFSSDSSITTGNDN